MTPVSATANHDDAALGADGPNLVLLLSTAMNKRQESRQRIQELASQKRKHRLAQKLAVLESVRKENNNIMHLQLQVIKEAEEKVVQVMKEAKEKALQVVKEAGQKDEQIANQELSAIREAEVEDVLELEKQRKEQDEEAYRQLECVCSDFKDEEEEKEAILGAFSPGRHRSNPTPRTLVRRSTFP
jgi:hypothetical protein